MIDDESYEIYLCEQNKRIITTKKKKKILKIEKYLVCFFVKCDCRQN